MPRKSPRHAAAALTRVAREGGHAVSLPARQAFDAKFIDQVDPDRTLSDDERARRVSAARRAYFLSLAAKSADARRRRAQADELRRLADEIDGAA
jgi:DNA-binding IclR family transcriptional regulator